MPQLMDGMTAAQLTAARDDAQAFGRLMFN